MSDNSTIKNPNRQSEGLGIKYEPEHKRLNKTPIPYIPREAVMSFDAINIASNGEEVEYKDSQIIDNNDVVNLDYPSQFYRKKPDNIKVISTLDPSLMTASEHSVDIKNKIEQPLKSRTEKAPNIGQYILMVRGKVILTSNKDEVEKKVSGMLYGQDADLVGITENDIVILKRVPVKIGIFLDE